MTNLSNVKKLGQQIWLDNLSRSLVKSGELATFLQNGVCGVTSNPAIFQKAFSGDKLYTPEIEILKKQGKSAKEIYETLAIADVQAACDVCRAEFDSTNGKTGFVSLEVSPKLSQDAAGTIAEAKRLYTAINRPNVMIKVPATDEGLVALTELVGSGINVNLTLLFSRKQTIKSYESYIAGLKKLVKSGGDVRKIQVVASFFISRIDSALDVTLPENLQGKIAISLAKAAYQDWENFFVNALAGLPHANRVSLLWASTGVKNSAYRDTMYVEELIGQNTVNTVPDATLKAFIAHGKVRGLTLPENTEQALANIAEAEKLGVDLEVLATRLRDDGLKQFEAAFDKLLAPLA